MSEYMILVIGDTHIPDRASRINCIIEDFINERKPYDIVVFTGDFTDPWVVDWVKGLGHEVYYVRGNMDYLPLPKTALLTIDEVPAGVHHGDGVYPRGNIRQLSSIARRLGVRILFSGHTHSPFIKVDERNRILHINPGSLTGVWGGGGGLMKPSFIEINYKDGLFDIKMYILEHSKLLVYEHTRLVYQPQNWIHQ